MNRRKRKRRKKRSAAANVRRQRRERYLPDSKTAKASNYIHWLKKYHRKHPDMVAILYNRESSRPQDYKRNHDIHEQVLSRICTKLNIPVSGFYCETCSGKMLNADRRALSQAVREAIEKISRGRNAVILATSTDRFLRNIDFHTKDNPDVLPIETEFEKLQKITHGVPLVTLLRPDRPWKEVRGHQSKWGQWTKGNKGGRPILKRPGYKKKRRKMNLPIVLKFHKQNKSFREISALTGIAKSTVADWVRKYSK